uniref:B30.2/SPRY domain-containing protein n=1 Tax=Chrysemys picta bellii TaxID=8478 RepID=A0A8C3P7D5_CHRPI
QSHCLCWQEEILSCLQRLREEREEPLGLKSKGDRESERLLVVERQLVVSECERLRQFLAEQEHLLLARLGELDEEIGGRREENITHLCKEISRLSALITELEDKCQQPALELLQVRLSDTPRAQCREGTTPELFGAHRVTQCRERLRRARGFAVDVTLDPDTAQPKLILSEDRKRVRHGDEEQALPNNPERFDTYPEVLGAEGFAGGRRYWEVEVGDKPDWALGVCRDSVSRKGENDISPEDGYWAVCLTDGEYKAVTCPSTSLPVSVRPSRVGIFLDYEAGEVSFYNVTDRSHLFTFTDNFSGTLRPYFCPGYSAGGKNTAPLIICPVLAQAGGNVCP